MTVASETTSA